MQVSKDIAEDALTILEGLGLLATEYGFTDYLHGHYPESVNHKDQTFVVKFPSAENSSVSTNGSSESTEQNAAALDVLGGYFVSVPTGGSSSFLLRTTSDVSDSPDNCAKAALSGLNTRYEQQHELILLSILRAVDGLKGSQKERLRVVCLRVQCLLIISHSRLTHDLLHPYIKAGSTVLRDLISLSDISSEALSALQLEYSSLSAVTLILNCILGIFEFNLRRRGPLLTGILLELGLTRTGVYCSERSVVLCHLLYVLYLCSHYHLFLSVSVCFQHCLDKFSHMLDCMCVYLCMYMCVSVYLRVCICVCVCVHLCVCLFTAFSQTPFS